MAVLWNDYLYFVPYEVPVDIVDELRSFLATAQTGSFTAAADQLGISNRLTSKYVGELETRLGVRLFQRTTRKVGLTPAGETLLGRVPAVLDELDDMLGEVTDSAVGMSGIIRISAPVTFGEIYVSRMLLRFSQVHPNIRFDLRLSDFHVDLAVDGIDLAFRMGKSETLSIKSRKLGTSRSIIAASPEYLAEHGTPATLADLSDHNCIIDTNRRMPRRWTFKKGTSTEIAKVQGSYQVNSAGAAVDLAQNGIGIVYAPLFAANEALKSGSLVPILEGLEGETSPLSAVYLEGRTLPRKMRSLIDFAVQDVRETNILQLGS